MLQSINRISKYLHCAAKYASSLCFVWACCLPLLASAQEKTYPQSGNHLVKMEDLPDKAKLTKMLDQKLALLADDLQMLINKKSRDANKVVNNAMMLWNNDDTKTIMVYSTDQHKFKYKKHVRDYLKAMSALPYKNATVTFGQYIFVNNIFRAPDGKYHGYVEFTQAFNSNTAGDAKLGKMEEMLKGKVEIIIEALDYIDNAGKERTVFYLFLGDMSIEETR